MLRNLEATWTLCFRCGCNICRLLRTTLPASLRPLAPLSTIPASTTVPAIVTATAKARARMAMVTTITPCRYPPLRIPHPRPSDHLILVHLHHHPVPPTPSSRSKDYSPVPHVQDHLLGLRHPRRNRTPKRASRSVVPALVSSGCSSINIPGTEASPAALSGRCRLSRPP